jgi:serine kinase of HPr protein (carbohydrate metabolism regulator)
MIIHAGLIASLQNARWRGVLIQGPSGTGKSDLAIRSLGYGFRIVADDRVLIFKSGKRVFGRAPGAVRGLLELRGLGVIPVTSLRFVEVALVVTCVESHAVERMPNAESCVVLGAELPAIMICPFEASAPAKLCRAIEVLGRARQQDYDAAFPQTAPRGLT